MFYSQFILAKKGPLGTIWIAAHLERKLRKNQVFETDIPQSVRSIIFPEVPIALRLSGHLLLGVVRIYSRKVTYLFNDCSDALTKIKQAFNPAAVDLPPDVATAPFHSITLPENFDLAELDFLTELGPAIPRILDANYVDQNTTTRDQITLPDPFQDDYYYDSQIGPDERFVPAGEEAAGMELDEDVLNLPRGDADADTFAMGEQQQEHDDDAYGFNDDKLPPAELDIGELEDLPTAEAAPAGAAGGLQTLGTAGGSAQGEAVAVPSEEAAPAGAGVPAGEAEEGPGAAEGAAAGGQLEPDVEMERRGEGAAGDQTEEEEERAGLEVEAVRGEAAAAAMDVDEPLHLHPLAGREEEVEQEEEEEVAEVERLRSAATPAQERQSFGAADGLMDLVPPPTEATPVARGAVAADEGGLGSEGPALEAAGPPPSGGGLSAGRLSLDDDFLLATPGGAAGATPSGGTDAMETPDLVVATPATPAGRRRRAAGPGPRKRKVVVDAATVVPSEVMKAQLGDTSDICRKRRRAPHTQRHLEALHLLALGGGLFLHPSVSGLPGELSSLFSRVLVPGRADLPLAPRREPEPEPAEVLPEDMGVGAEQLQEEAEAEQQPQPPAHSAAPDEAPGGVPPDAALEPIVERVLDLDRQELLEVATPPPPPADMPSPGTTPGAAQGPAGEGEGEGAGAGGDVAMGEEEGAGAGAGVGVGEEEAIALEQEAEVEGVVGEVRLGDEALAGPPDEPERLRGEEAAAEQEEQEFPVADIGQGMEPQEHAPPPLADIDFLPLGDEEGPEAGARTEEEQQPDRSSMYAEGLNFLGDTQDAGGAEDNELEEMLDTEPEGGGKGKGKKGRQERGDSGWSTRTRAVVKYLQSAFEGLGGGGGDTATEEEAQAPRLALDSMVAGKPRKEAARMFFETLVLKSRDFVHVEQVEPYGEIFISARPKLMKAQV